MPVCVLTLLALREPLQRFLSALTESKAAPLVIARVVRWIITPTEVSASHLLTQDPPWDILLILPGSKGLPKQLRMMARAEWTITAGIPSRIVSSFHTANNRYLHPKPGDVPLLTGSLDNKPLVAGSAQSLELTEELQEWIRTYGGEEGGGAVSMLNLLAFKEGKKAEYMKYGKAFANSVGSRRGGKAKIVGNVLSCSSSPPGVTEWDEIALAHYPSIYHFADMLASKDYQEANHRWRVDSLKDTFILCTTELNLPIEDKTNAKL
ncbi:MAG: hypothetical protein M1827_004262 [Pycnora praestabilis]|nr:MAG: hypothetical protein M1827_004262 [Pycnora praestabilis]